MSLIRPVESEIDGISIFAPEITTNHNDYRASGLKALEKAEKYHFWFMARRERIVSTFLNYLPLHSSNKRVLEIGSGTGYVAEGLQRAGYELSVGDIHLSGLQYAKEKGITDCYQFDLFKPPFTEEFDAVGMFDVLEHLEDDANALRQAVKMIKKGGKMFITVPAHQCLWSRADTVAGHKRRYNKQKLEAVASKAGLNVKLTEYFFISILPLLFFRHIFNRDGKTEVASKEINSEVESNSLLNSPLLAFTRLENRCSKWLPNVAGGSLLCVAEK